MDIAMQSPPAAAPSSLAGPGGTRGAATNGGIRISAIFSLFDRSARAECRATTVRRTAVWRQEPVHHEAPSSTRKAT